MIENKIIKFGYGTVLVYSNDWERKVVLKHIEPPKPIGKLIEKDIYDVTVLNQITFNFALDMVIFYDQLKQVNSENAVLVFRGYTFDFTNFNEESLKVVITGFKRAINGFQLALAC